MVHVQPPEGWVPQGQGCPSSRLVTGTLRHREEREWVQGRISPVLWAMLLMPRGPAPRPRSTAPPPTCHPLPKRFCCLHICWETNTRMNE